MAKRLSIKSELLLVSKQMAYYQADKMPYCNEILQCSYHITKLLFLDSNHDIDSYISLSDFNDDAVSMTVTIVLFDGRNDLRKVTLDFDPDGSCYICVPRHFPVNGVRCLPEYEDDINANDDRFRSYVLDVLGSVRLNDFTLMKERYHNDDDH